MFHLATRFLSFFPGLHNKLYIYLLIFQAIYLLVGVFLGFSKLEILLVYIIEASVMFAFGLLKIHKSEGTSVVLGLTINKVPVHLLSKSKIITSQLILDGSMFSVYIIIIFAIVPEGKIDIWVLAVAFTNILITQLILYFKNFVGQNEYKLISPSQQSHKLFIESTRTFLLIWTAAFFSRGPNSFIVIFILTKLIVDIGVYIFERRKLKKAINLSDASTGGNTAQGAASFIDKGQNVHKVMHNNPPE